MTLLMATTAIRQGQSENFAGPRQGLCLDKFSDKQTLTTRV